MTSYIIHTKPKEGSYLIVAFPTVGYISILAVNYLIHKKLVKEVGYIDLEVPEQLAVIDEGKITYPIRIFEGEHGIFVTTQFPVDLKFVKEITDTIVDIYNKTKSKAIITLDAINAAEEKKESGLFYVANKFDVNIKGATSLNEGVMLGLNASIALEARKKGLPFLALMAETHTSIPDGDAASKLIDGLNQITKINVDTAELVEEYKTVLSSLNKLIERAKSTQEKKSEMYG